MARKRVVEPSGVKTWEDANDALRQIAEAQLALADIEGEMNKQILGAKKAAEEQSKPYKDRVAKLERELKDFVTEHRADMGKTKTRALTFGEVGFRLSTSVSLPRAKEKIEEIIRRLKTRQMMDCIVVKEDVSKEALKKYGEDTVNAVGATWKQQDVFGYELNFSKLEQVKAGLYRRGRDFMRVDITSTRKKYRVIYADPPWKFSSKEATGKNRGGGKNYQL